MRAVQECVGVREKEVIVVPAATVPEGMTAMMKEKRRAENVAPAAKPIDPVPELVPAAPVGQQEDDEEIIAVIAAAVAAIAASEGTRLSVRSYRRVGAQAPAWSRAGREDIMANRF